MPEAIVFDTAPDRWHHWDLTVDGAIATLTLHVDPGAGVLAGYELKLNSYDLGVDIELRDAVDRLRFEYPEVRVVVVTGGLDRVFCAGANIQMLAGATHAHKVNFCKFTNETRLAIEEATSRSGQVWLAALNGAAAGGGYELALACDEIILVDDGSSAVSLPELPLLAVLPGTGGLTRLVDKRFVRRDVADLFATRAEGVKGGQALEWGLVDHLAPRSRFDDTVRARAEARAAGSDRPVTAAGGMQLRPLAAEVTGDALAYPNLTVTLDRDLGAAFFEVRSPTGAQPADPVELAAAGDGAWVVAVARELDDALLRLRFNEPAIGSWVFRATGNADRVLGAESILGEHADHWLVREVRLLVGRTLRRLDVSSRSLVAVIEPGTCFAGLLAELAFAADRSFMMEGAPPESAPPVLRLSPANAGWFPMWNGLGRLASRYRGHDDRLAAVTAAVGKDLLADEARSLGLVTLTPDELDWDDELRLALEERRGFSPDALTGMEANLRFAGPETMETKIFARLSAWQNWIFQRPNATGPDGALLRYGTGSRPSFDRTRA